MNYIIGLNFFFIFLIDSRKLGFSLGLTNPLEFIVQFEKCFNITTESRNMKTQLIKFVPEEDKQVFSNFVIELDYQSMKEKFIDTYLDSYLENRFNAINIKLEEFKVTQFIKTKFNGLKKFTEKLDCEIIEDILISLPYKISKIFYQNRTFKDYKDMIEYSKVLDRYASNKSSSNSEREDRNLGLESNEIRNFNSSKELISYAISERDNEQEIDDEIFLKIREQAKTTSTEVSKEPLTCDESSSNRNANDRSKLKRRPSLVNSETKKRTLKSKDPKRLKATSSKIKKKIIKKVISSRHL